jgi:hypothetical protein
MGPYGINLSKPKVEHLVLLIFFTEETANIKVVRDGLRYEKNINQEKFYNFSLFI